MSKNQMPPAPLSRFGVLVAQLESIVASAAHKSSEPLLCFDLLSDLISAIDEDTKDNILVWQRRCEDALYSLLVIGARRPVRHLASVAMAMIISKGDGISVYSRASSLQGFLSDGKKSEPQKIAGAAQCLGELYKHFGRRITSGLLETTIIAAKLMRFNEEFVRQEALYMLRNALDGSGGSAASTAYSEAFRIIMRTATGDKSFAVRIAAARCLKAFASIGGPGLGVAELDNSASYCVKALEDPVSSVRDAFAEILGSLLALGMNPEAQIQPRGKGPLTQAKKLEGGLQKHLISAFTKASGVRSRDVRVGLTLSWVFFLQAIRIKYLHPDSELQNFALQVMEMLHAETSVDAHALACVLYVLRVGVTDQMTEPTQRNFLLFLAKQLQSPEAGPSMMVAALRTLSYTLKTLGEVPVEFKEVLDNTVVAAVSHSSKLVRIEAALALRALAEVDPTCVGGLTSYGVTNLTALRESVSFEKGSNLQFELDSLHGQATVLAALVSTTPKLPLGYPARLPRLVFGVSKKMLTEHSRNPIAATVEKEAGWLLLSSLLASLPKEELEEDVFDILSLWATLFIGNPESEITKTDDLMSTIYVWSAAVHALTAFIKCFISPNVLNDGVLLQPVLVYLNSALSYISALRAKELPNVKPAVDIFVIKTLIAYQSLPDPVSFKNDHPQIIQLCTFPFRHASECEESSCLRMLLDKRDAWLGPWVPGRDWFEDELRAFQGGKDGIMPCVWENEISIFPQPETISKTLVNQMLLFFGIIFASQDSGGMLSLLGVIEQCLKAGRKQHWRTSSITNICAGLLAGFKALLSFRPQTLGQEILGLVQSIFQSILAEGDICVSQRRASSEGLGYLARFGNDIFTARMTRSLLGDLNGATDSYYAGSIALALGCIHRSAGGIALSTLVPTTVNSISSLAKSLVANLQIWSMHGLLLTIEAAGLSFVSHVQMRGEEADMRAMRRIWSFASPAPIMDNSHKSNPNTSYARATPSSGSGRGRAFDMRNDRERPRGRGGGGGRSGSGKDKIDALGRLLTRILRHMASELNLNMRSDGYVNVKDLLNLNLKTFANIPLRSHNIDDVREAVRKDNKQRFSLIEENGELLIRANQGHTVTAVETESLLKPILSAEEAPVCVHGTYKRNLESILTSGLKRMKRLHVHFSRGLPTDGEVISGMRRDVNVLIFLDVRKALEEGMKLYISDNKVILSEGFEGVVPPKYFQKIESWPGRQPIPF